MGEAGGRIRGCGRDDQLHYGGHIDLTACNGAESRSRSDVGQVEIFGHGGEKGP